MALTLLSTFVLVLGFASAGNTTSRVTECPLAVLSCRPVPSSSKFECAVTAQVASAKYAPQYEWRVSGGKLSGNGKSFVTVDASAAKSDSIVVTANVHWKNTPRICDRSLEETLQLQRQ